MSASSRWPSILMRLAPGDAALMKTLNALRRAIRRGDLDDVAAVVTALDAAERRAVGERMPALLKAVREERGWLDENEVSHLLLAGAGTIGGPAAAAAWVCRTELRSWVRPYAETVRAVVEILQARSPEWRAEFTRRVAERMDGSRRDEPDRLLWHVIDRLARDAGDGPPPGEAYLLGWLRWGPPPDLMGRDPFLEALAPRLLESESAGMQLRGELTAGPPQRTRLEALVRLVEEGRLERETLLEGCLRRLLRGGRDNALRWFAALHDRLNPTPTEARTHLRDYLRLLPTAPTPVAETALHQIRRIDEHTPLDEASFTEAADALLFRPEKKLLRTTLTWLNKTARTHHRADATVQAVTALFPHDDLDLRERAVKTAAEHAPHTNEHTRRTVRQAAADLPADLRTLLTPAYGPIDPPTTEPPPLPGPPPFTPAPPPTPITSPAQLTEELSVCLAERNPAFSLVERLMAALVEHARRDLDGTREVLARLVPERPPWAWPHRSVRPSDDRIDWLAAAVRTILDRTRRVPDATAAARHSLREGRMPFTCSLLYRLTAWRMLTAAHSVGFAPTLLATPTEASGHIDPGALVARMELLEEAGVEPAEPDFEQALLRLPRDIDADAVTRARALVSPAGKTLAERLAAGAYADPVVTCRGRVLHDHFNHDPKRSFFVVARVRPQEETDDSLAARILRLPVTGDDWKQVPPFPSYEIDWWPSLLPSHREVAAAHLQFHLQKWVEAEDFGRGAALLGLAEADGPTGPATAAALAYSLGCANRAERSGAVDALLAFSAQGALPAADLGAVIGMAGSVGRLKLNRIAQALTDAAHAGAYADVWTVVHAAVPALLPEPGERAPAGLPDLIALGTKTAEVTGLRTPLPELAPVAGRGGASRLVREAARLHRLLTGEAR
ncbi:DUF6493 family protein [Thermomonospora catenispora]|uniref:DUF6493 family protein n=1 Tax=Thermomonospora catenispora TaxID=2493090 RepID=UPI00111E07C9|nr:DUF6493 family protein [Thermomonospora catenispora]TNY34962.1 hypothetical protein EIO00_21090 [Thermomonospora catenispora]